MKPNWNSAELADGTAKRFIFAPLEKRGGNNFLNLEYVIRERDKYCSLLFNSKYFNSEFDKGETTVRRYRWKTFFEKNSGTFYKGRPL